MPEYIERDVALLALSYYPIENPDPGYIIQAVLETARNAIASINAADVAPVRYGSIVQTVENGHMKRVFSCCGTDFTQMTCWMIPKYCPECGAILRI